MNMVRISMILVCLGAVSAVSYVVLHFSEQSKKWEADYLSVQADLQQLQEEYDSYRISAQNRMSPINEAPAYSSRPVFSNSSSVLKTAKVETNRHETFTVRMPTLSVDTNAMAASGRRGERPEGRSWMESLKESDPVRFKEMQAVREQTKNQIQNSFAKKSLYLLDRDTSGMDGAEAEEYNKMITLLDNTWRLSEKLQMQGLSRAERRPLMQSVRDNVKQLAPLLLNERDMEFYRTGLKMGYDETQAAQFVDQMNNVIEVTSVQSLYDSMHNSRQGHSGHRTEAGFRHDSSPSVALQPALPR